MKEEKEKMEKKDGKEEKGGEKKAGKKHLHQIRTVEAEDGTYVHHHTYKKKKEDAHTEPERENVATSQDADEAGEHVAENMGQNQQEPEEEAEPAGDEGAAPTAGAAPAMPGQ